MSLKAGGVGINLTAASSAFVLVCVKIKHLTSNCNVALIAPFKTAERIGDMSSS